jgi:hypothetical protein
VDGDRRNARATLGACDGVVCLIGVAFGGEPSERPADQPRRSYSQLEYFLATKLDKPVFRLLADEKTAFDADSLEPESAELRRIQDDYRAAIIGDRDWRGFANVDQLRAELAEPRFPRDGPPPDHKPNNLPLVSIGTLFKGREGFLDELRKRLEASDGRASAIVNRLAVHGLGGDLTFPVTPPDLPFVRGGKFARGGTFTRSGEGGDVFRSRRVLSAAVRAGGTSTKGSLVVVDRGGCSSMSYRSFRGGSSSGDWVSISWLGQNSWIFGKKSKPSHIL